MVTVTKKLQGTKNVSKQLLNPTS